LSRLAFGLGAEDAMPGVGELRRKGESGGTKGGRRRTRHRTAVLRLVVDVLVLANCAVYLWHGRDVCTRSREGEC